MYELSLPERKEIGINILNELDKICREHGITYFLAYGTLIGAVRHNGFIPWDDDIDVWVPIGDYEKLLSVLTKESKYQVLNNISDVHWPRCFAKLSDSTTIIEDGTDENKFATPRGVAVDLFPLFGCKNDRKWLEGIVRIRDSRLRMYNYENGILSKSGVVNKGKIAYSALCRMIGHSQEYYAGLLLNKEKELTETGYLGCPISPYNVRDVHNETAFSRTVQHVFEDGTYPIPVGWDSILTDLYGNYMQLPPVEKQITNHNVRAYRVKE